VAFEHIDADNLVFTDRLRRQERAAQDEAGCLVAVADPVDDRLHVGKAELHRLITGRGDRRCKLGIGLRLDQGRRDAKLRMVADTGHRESTNDDARRRVVRLAILQRRHHIGSRCVFSEGHRCRARQQQQPRRDRPRQCLACKRSGSRSRRGRHDGWTCCGAVFHRHSRVECRIATAVIGIPSPRDEV